MSLLAISLSFLVNATVFCTHISSLNFTQFRAYFPKAKGADPTEVT